MKMKLTYTPACLVLVALLVWGWRNDRILFAIGMGILFESHRLMSWRFQLGPLFMRRFFRLSYLSMWAIGLYTVFQYSLLEAIFITASWLPLIYFPVCTLQNYTTSDPGNGPPMIHLNYPYFILCLVTSALSLREPQYFLPIMALLIGWGYWPFRSKRFHSILWMMTLGLSLWLGLTWHRLFIEHQRDITEKVERFYELRFSPSLDDPTQSSTAIGHIGLLKLSHRIHLRIRGLNAVPPGLLRMSSFDMFSGNTWYTSTPDFKTIQNAADAQETWPLMVSDREAPYKVGIRQFMLSDKALLALPAGTVALEKLRALQGEQSPAATVKMMGLPGYIDYEAHFDPKVSREPEPTERDVKIVRGEKELMRGVVESLALEGLSPQEQLDKIRTHFEAFEYSLDLKAGGDDLPALDDFLLKSRRGHCEYFATATTLLLRELGVPTRYVTGYSVQEYSNLEKQFIVRRRHAHAWTIAWVDGQWIDVDFTPPSWNREEADDAPTFLSLYDVVSAGWAALTQWRSGDRNAKSIPLSFLVVALVFLLLLLWWFLRRAGKSERVEVRSQQSFDYPGLDSPCFRIEQHLMTEFGARKPSETLSDWFKRIKASEPELLSMILRMHQRYRFDPKGLNEQEFREFHHLVDQWFAKVSN